jgi:hypothetical protein
MSDKLCIDCKWCDRDSGPRKNAWDIPFCSNPACNEPNLVFGGFHNSQCNDQRYKKKGKCGKEGKYWEARE